MRSYYTDYSREANNYIEKLITTLKLLDMQTVSDVINTLTDVLSENGTVYVFGNGGSASTASHMQNDFNRGVSECSDEKFKFCCLSDNVATITAIANDYSYDDIYFRQLEKRLLPQDLIIAISGSGNSENVIKAVKYAKSQGNKVIGITGFDGGELKKLADFNLHADINDMQIAEDVHLILNHLMMSVLRQKLINGAKKNGL